MAKLTVAEKLAAAIQRAGFKPGSDEGQHDWVVGRLTSALQLYAWRMGQDPDIRAPLRTERKHLVGVINAARALKEHLRALSVADQSELGMPPGVIEDHAGGQVFIPFQAARLDPLDELIARVESIQKARSGGRPGNEALEGLLLEITVQWRCAFDPDPDNNPFLGIVYHGNTAENDKRYQGPLLDFAFDVLKSQNIPCGVRSALGRRLYDLVTKEWKMSRHENSPAKPQ